MLHIYIFVNFYTVCYPVVGGVIYILCFTEQRVGDSTFATTIVMALTWIS